MRKVHPWVKEDGGSIIGYNFWCPGCKGHHGVWTGEPNPTTGAQWTFNGDLEKPTFSPSINIHLPTIFIDTGGERCHFHITEGKISYCGDCTHSLVGQTVEMEDMD